MAGRASVTPAGRRDGVQAGSSDARFRRAVPAEPQQLAVLRRDLRTWLGARGVAGTAADDVLIGVGEAAANAIEHAYADDAPGLLEVEVDLTADGELRVMVRDAGRWRAGRVEGGEGGADRGRGIAMMRAVGSEVRYDRSAEGTTVRFRVAGRADQPGGGAPPSSSR